MSAGYKSSHSGFLDVSCSNGGLRISGCIGQLSCLTSFYTSLSLAAFLRRAGSSVLESTGSHWRGVECRVPEMRCKLLKPCSFTVNSVRIWDSECSINECQFTSTTKHITSSNSCSCNTINKWNQQLARSLYHTTQLLKFSITLASEWASP